METIETTMVTAENLETLRETWPAVDQREEIGVGDVLWKILGSQTHCGLLSPSTARAGVCRGGDTQWGDAEGELPDLRITLDEGGVLNASGESICPYEGCTKLAIEHDHDGDLACEEHAAQSERWVIVECLNGGPWLDEEHAPAVEEKLEELGYDVQIRSPLRGEAEGTYYRKGDGTLQITGYTVPTPDCLKHAINRAWQSVMHG